MSHIMNLRAELDVETIALLMAFLLLLGMNIFSSVLSGADKEVYSELGGVLRQLRERERLVLIELYSSVDGSKLHGRQDLNRLATELSQLSLKLKEIGVDVNDIFQVWVKDEISAELSCTCGLLQIAGARCHISDWRYNGSTVCSIYRTALSGSDWLRALREVLLSWSSRKIKAYLLIAIYLLASIYAILRFNWLRLIRTLSYRGVRRITYEPVRLKDFLFMFSIQFLTYLLALMFISKGMMTRSGEEAFRLNIKSMMIGYVITISISLILFWRKLLPPYNWKRFKQWVNVGLMRGLKLFLASSVFIVALELGFNEMLGGRQLSSSPLIFFSLLRGDYHLFLITVAALAPIYEELTFRVGLYGFLRRYMGVIPAALISSLAFAVVHPENPLAMLVLAILGGVLALTYELSGNPLAPIAYHSLWNLMTFIIALLQ